MDRINVRVDGRLKHLLGAAAKGRGVSPSDLVRELLEEHLGSRGPAETCLDVARRLDLVGRCKGLPADLSTDPGHLDGFGRG